MTQLFSRRPPAPVELALLLELTTLACSVYNRRNPLNYWEYMRLRDVNCHEVLKGRGKEEEHQ